MSHDYLQPYEKVGNPRTIAQQNFDTIRARLWFASPTNGTTSPGAPTTGTWELDEYYWDSNRVRWRCTGAGTPGTWVQDSGPGADGAAGVPVGRWDFNRITAAHSSRKAYFLENTDPTSRDPDWIIAAGAPFIDASYAALWNPGATGTSFTPSGGRKACVLFKVLVGLQPGATKITARALVSTPSGGPSEINLYAWNGSVWVGDIGSVSADTAFVEVSGDVVSGISTYIDADGYVFMLLVGDTDKAVAVDYFALDIENAAAPNGEPGPVGATGAGSTGANPTSPVSLTAVNGVASTFMRSDGSPALDTALAAPGKLFNYQNLR